MFTPSAIIIAMIDKLFYAEKTSFSNSKSAIEKILSEFYGIESPIFSYTENGKPFLKNGELSFSISHTDKLLFLAFSDTEIGIDAEMLTREVNYLPILKKLHPTVCEKIHSNEDFLRIWTILESAVKYIGGRIARDLKEFSIQNDTLYYQNQPFKATFSTQVFDNHFITVCGKDFDNVSFMKLS